MGSIVFEWIQSSNIRLIDKEDPKIRNSSHCSFPSLHPVIRAFDRFGIERITRNVSPAKENFDQLLSSLIGQVKTKNIKHSTATIKHRKGGTGEHKIYSKEYFLDDSSFLVDEFTQKQ